MFTNKSSHAQTTGQTNPSFTPFPCSFLEFYQDGLFHLCDANTRRGSCSKRDCGQATTAAARATASRAVSFLPDLWRACFLHEDRP